MGFVIQWVVYLVAFVGGSAIAYGIVALMNKTRARASAGAESVSVGRRPTRLGRFLNRRPRLFLIHRVLSLGRRSSCRSLSGLGFRLSGLGMSLCRPGPRPRRLSRSPRRSSRGRRQLRLSPKRLTRRQLG